MKRASLCLSLVCALIALSSCTTPFFTMPPGPRTYRIGFRDGCDAGYSYAGSPAYGPAVAMEPTQSDQLYRAGWHAGFDKCRASYQRIQRTISSVLGPP